MQFTLIDNVLEQSQDRIRAVKRFGGRGYLTDRFRAFPFCPGS